MSSEGTIYDLDRVVHLQVSFQWPDTNVPLAILSPPKIFDHGVSHTCGSRAERYESLELADSAKYEQVGSFLDAGEDISRKERFDLPLPISKVSLEGFHQGAVGLNAQA